jgi:hypothetical protein
MPCVSGAKTPNSAKKKDGVAPTLRGSLGDGAGPYFTFTLLVPLFDGLKVVAPLTPPE